MLRVSYFGKCPPQRNLIVCVCRYPSPADVGRYQRYACATFDGNASSSVIYEENATLRNQISALGPQGRVASRLLHMTDFARKVCMSVGKDDIGNAGGMAHISRILREQFPHGAIGSIFQDFKRAGQNMGTYFMDFDMLRQKAGARMLAGNGSPDEFGSALRMRNAVLSKSEKTLVLASI